MPNSSIPWTVWSHELYSPWNSPGQNTGVGSLSLLQGIFATQGSRPGPLYCRQILYQLSHKGSPRYANDTTLMSESEEQLKSLLRVKKESERACLKLHSKKTKIMASSPITSWQIKGEKVEVVTDILFLGSEITADGHCSEIRRWLFLGRKTVTNLDSVLGSKAITLPTKVRIVKDIVFPVVTYGCESWTVRKAEHKKIDAFELCWRRFLRVPWIARRSKQVNLKGNQPRILIGMTDAEAPVFWSPDANSWLIGKVPDAGKDGGQKEKSMWEDEMAGWNHQCNGHKLEQTSGDGEGQRDLACYSSRGHKESDTTGRLNI